VDREDDWWLSWMPGDDPDPGRAPLAATPREEKDEDEARQPGQANATPPNPSLQDPLPEYERTTESFLLDSPPETVEQLLQRHNLKEDSPHRPLTQSEQDFYEEKLQLALSVLPASHNITSVVAMPGDDLAAFMGIRPNRDGTSTLVIYTNGHDKDNALLFDMVGTLTRSLHHNFLKNGALQNTSMMMGVNEGLRFSVAHEYWHAYFVSTRSFGMTLFHTASNPLWMTAHTLFSLDITEVRDGVAGWRKWEANKEMIREDLGDYAATSPAETFAQMMATLSMIDAGVLPPEALSPRMRALGNELFGPNGPFRETRSPPPRSP
jgi:hypothetical protein